MLTKPSFIEEDFETTSIRPQLLQEFTGQEHLKDQLSIALQAAKKRGDAMDHTLFYGPPGLGKTTLSGIIARNLKLDLSQPLGQ